MRETVGMSERLTPEDRAYHDALADAVAAGIYGEDALKYADGMRHTFWFAMRTLRHAGVDVVTAVRNGLRR